jgi:glycyl-tRNA synthetase beta chain
MTDFLLELRCEEIPARMQLKALEDFARLFTEELAKAGLKPEAIDSFVTPRRLALIARNLPLETAAVSEEFKGPRTSAPAQALEGFLRKTGLTQDQLEERDGVWFATVNKPGRATAEVLAQAVPAVVRAFPWPKSMRWGAASHTTESLRWVRPLQGIVAILGDDLVDIEIEGIRSGYATLGHRFHHPGEITIGGAHDYVEKLRACHVIVSHQERQSIIEAKANEAAAAKGYTVIEDKGLVAENAGLTEWPVPLLGDFDPAFLDVPPEVIQLTLRINQKYFVLRDGLGKLAPAFICTANIEAKDGGEAIIAGNRKVLAARLSDARFFWEQDRKTKLEDHAKKLERITFHERLGTVKRKVERVATIAADRIPELVGWPVEKARKMQPLLRQAAELAKADLVTEMVGEFPELQGVMGGYYADAEGLPVSAAIRDHYKPMGQNDDLPSDELGTVISLADKVDTLYSFFLIDQKPTGSKDPYALRRAALGLIRLIVDKNLRVSLGALFGACDWERLYQSDGVNYADPTHDLVSFTIDRLKVQQKEAGVRHDLIDAVFALGGEDDLVRLLARVKALQSFIATDVGTNLLAGYKRAANILKKEGIDQSVMPAKAGISGGASDAETSASAGVTPMTYTPEPAEAELIAALDAAEPCASAAVQAEDFEGAMGALASLRAPIDAFFDKVTVNDADPAKRLARLALLARVRDAVHAVADFSKIAG